MIIGCYTRTLNVAAKMFTSVSLRNEDLKKPYQGIVIRLPYFLK